MTDRMPEPILAPSTVEWCVQRDHPWVTYNPRLDQSYCRCGARQADGEQPMDWRALHEISHACDYDADRSECRCYVGPKTSAKEAAR